MLVVIPVVAAGVALFAFTWFGTDKNRVIHLTMAQRSAWDKELLRLSNDIYMVTFAVSQLQPTNLPLTPSALQFVDLTNRLSQLEAGIKGVPTNVLAVPLLRQDIENLRAIYTRDAEVSARKIDRIYQQNKWFVGLIFATAFSVVILVVRSFLEERRRRAKDGSTVVV